MIHLTGDSLMARYEGYKQPIINEILKRLNPQIEIINTAHAGDNTTDLLARMDTEILSHTNADRIFMLIGINDLALNKQVKLKQFEENIGKIVDKLRTRYPTQRIYFITLAPVDESKQVYRTNKLVKMYTLQLRKVAIANNCQVLDLYQAFIKSEIPVNTLLQGIRNDGLHFGETGYVILAKLINGVC